MLRPVILGALVPMDLAAFLRDRCRLTEEECSELARALLDHLDLPRSGVVLEADEAGIREAASLLYQNVLLVPRGSCPVSSCSLPEGHGSDHEVGR
jgi:hypothetical protein